MLVANKASANYFIWNDADNDFTLSYPDTWQMQNPKTDDSRIRITSPIMEDRASCQVETYKDGRLNVYPKPLMVKAVEELLNKQFWDDKVAGMYKDSKVTEFFSPSIMGGRGDATAVRYAYSDDYDDARMYGAMIGSVYGGKRFIVECTALKTKFDDYSDLFSRIMESVQLEQRYSPFAIGYYRDFLSDEHFQPLDAKPGTKVQPNKGSFPLRTVWPY